MSLSRRQFLSRVLPTEGYLFSATRVDGARGSFWRHRAFETIEDLDANLGGIDAGGSTVYFACASYIQPAVDAGGGKFKERVATNVRLVRSIWFDLDVGPPEPGKPEKYPTRDEALDGILDFADLLGLPPPLLNESGPHGLHAYWTFRNAVDRLTWLRTATAIKEVAMRCGLKFDRTRTADAASILRAPGTHHRKGAPYLLSNLTEGADVEFARLAEIVEAAAGAAGVSVPQRTPGPDIVLEPGATDLNAGAGVEFQNVPSSAEKIADECAQLRAFRAQSATAMIGEPHWYSGIQLLMHTVGGEALVHKWSAGDPRYSAEQTSKKIAQVAGMGPTLCATFRDRNPAGCEGCPHRGQISTPLQLGYTQLQELPAPTVRVNGHEVELENVGAPFDRTAQGIFVTNAEGKRVRISKHDVFISAEAFDDGTNRRRFCVAHDSPLYGTREDWLDADLLASPVEFHKALLNAGVTIDRGRVPAMVQYMTAWLTKVQEKVKARRHVTAMGWREDPTGFQVGTRLYTEGEAAPVEAGISATISGQLDAFSTRGEISEWVDATETLNQREMLPHAFMFSCGFGAPILGATSYGGGLVVAHGNSNGGKTTVGRFLFSTWGSPLAARDNKSDTTNYKIKRLEFYGSIPMYIDEVTNLDPEALGDFAFSVTQGAGRGRLNANSTMMDKGTWSTIVIASSNNSYHQRIAAVPKFDVQAKRAMQLRVFEFEIPSLHNAARWGTKINRLVEQNYGLAGAVYSQWLANLGKAAIAEMFHEMFDFVLAEVGFREDERYWCAIVAAAMVGGLAAAELGLIRYDPLACLPWVKQTVAQLRLSMLESSMTATAAIARFVNDHIHGTVVVGDGQIKKGIASELVARFETDTRKLYITRPALRRYLDDVGMDYSYVRRELTNMGILLDSDRRYTLSKGYNLAVTVQEPCWVLSTEALVDVRHILEVSEDRTASSPTP